MYGAILYTSLSCATHTAALAVFKNASADFTPERHAVLHLAILSVCLSVRHIYEPSLNHYHGPNVRDI